MMYSQNNKEKFKKYLELGKALFDYFSGNKLSEYQLDLVTNSDTIEKLSSMRLISEMYNDNKNNVCIKR